MKEKLLLHLTLTILLLGPACSACVNTGESGSGLSQAEQNSHIEHIMQDARIQTQIQLNVLKKFFDGSAHTLIALFSESGYADRGQIIALTKDKFSKGELVSYPPNSPQPSEKLEDLSRSQLRTLKEISKNSLELDDYEKPSFDGVVFEFLLVQKKQDKSIHKKRIYMQSLGLPPGSSPEHEKLVDSLLDLR